MEYRGPQPGDYRNVRALNRAFLQSLVASPGRDRWLAGLPQELRARCAGLTALQRERLAAAPFLLFSIHETDPQYWDQLFEKAHSPDLFAEHGQDAAAALAFAALGFAWQLARQNAYTARLICGASLHWCEQLAERPLLDVFVAASCADVLSLRAASDEFLWRKLLYVGTSAERLVCNAAHLSALQRVLTRAQSGARAPAALVARPVNAPSRRVADEIDR